MALGNNPGTPGPLGAAVGASALVLMAGLVVWWTREWLRGYALALIVLAIALAGWSGLSIMWAWEPSLAWLATNRAMMFTAAVIIGAGLAFLVPHTVGWFAPGVAIAGALPVMWSLAGVALPSVLGSDGSLARLSEPVGHPNVLGLVAVMVLAGALAAPARNLSQEMVWAAISTAAAVCLVLSLSRGGVAAGVVAVAFVIATTPHLRVTLARTVSTVLFATPAAAMGIGVWALRTDGLATSQRVGAATVFAVALVVGMIAAGPASRFASARLPRARHRRGSVRWIAVRVGVLAMVAPLAVTVMRAETRECRSQAAANSAERIMELSANQRGAWWCEAIEGWKAAPVIGNGAGSFPLVELAHRNTPEDRLLTRDPHELWLEAGSATGWVGVLLLAAVWGLAGWLVVRRWNIVPAGVAAIPFAAFAQAQSDWVLSWPSALIPSGVALGMIAGCVGPRVRRHVGATAEAVGAGLLAALVLGLAFTAWLPYVSERSAIRAEDALARLDAQTALNEASQARTFNPLAVEPLWLRAEAFAISGQRDKEILELRRATALQPNNSRGWSRLAMVLGVTGDHDGAARAWDRVRELDPNRVIPVPPTG